VDQNDDVANFHDWREEVSETFEWETNSIMGNMSDHAHPVAARHVSKFVKHIEDKLGGTWNAVDGG
jgi:hypothetical protein